MTAAAELQPAVDSDDEQLAGDFDVLAPAALTDALHVGQRSRRDCFVRH